MRSFKYISNPGFPKLAWCLVARKNQPEILVFHGSFVETKSNFFVEGVWDSAFEEGQFDKSALLMGSGVSLSNDSIIIASPCHTLEKIYALNKGHIFYASNSLSFLVSAASTDLDVKHIAYHTDLASILLGLKRCVRQLPLLNSQTVDLHYCTNLIVDSELQTRVTAKPSPPPFNNFATYHNYCMDGLRRLFNNGSDSQRFIQYSPLASLSSGYDSACTTALAKSAGCDRAVTIASLSASGISDSGKPIAEVLGYKQIQEFGYQDYAKIEPMSEAEVFASGDLSLIRFNTFESQCIKSMLITGINGDVVWDKNNHQFGDFRRKESNLGGLSSGIAEFRLRLGCIHIPVPFFGASQHESLHQISNSQEMKPWVVGGHYDRPIPRRILEEMGVPRGLFGVGKRGIGIGVSYFPTRMHPESYRSLLAFSRSHRHKRSPFSLAGFWLLYFINCTSKAAVIGLRKLKAGKIPFPNVVPFKYTRSPGLASYMIPWGVSVLKDSRYKIPKF